MVYTPQYPTLCMACNEPAQREHTPCCPTHGDPMCCEHWVIRHGKEGARCSPETHARGWF